MSRTKGRLCKEQCSGSLNAEAADADRHETNESDSSTDNTDSDGGDIETRETTYTRDSSGQRQAAGPDKEKTDTTQIDRDRPNRNSNIAANNQKPIARPNYDGTIKT